MLFRERRWLPAETATAISLAHGSCAAVATQRLNGLINMTGTQPAQNNSCGTGAGRGACLRQREWLLPPASEAVQITLLPRCKLLHPPAPAGVTLTRSCRHSAGETAVIFVQW